MKKNSILITVAFALLIATATGCSKSKENSEILDNDISTDSISENSESNNYNSELENTSDINYSKSDSKVSLKTNDEETATECNAVDPINVTISNGSDSTDKTYASISDIDLNRPDNMMPDHVFMGWNENAIIQKIADKSIDVTSNINITAESTDISNMENAIFNDATYVNADIPTEFSIPIAIGGKTKFNTLDLEIEYDSSIMKFIKFQNVDSDLVCNCIPNENKIYISFSSSGNISGQIDLCDIIFSNIKSGSLETSLKYTVKDMAAYDKTTSAFSNAKYTIVNGKIVMY